MTDQDLVHRLRMRAEIRRQIPGRKSVEEGKPDRIADILDEAADEIEKLRLFREGAFHINPYIDLYIDDYIQKREAGN